MCVCVVWQQTRAIPSREFLVPTVMSKTRLAKAGDVIGKESRLKSKGVPARILKPRLAISVSNLSVKVSLIHVRGGRGWRAPARIQITALYALKPHENTQSYTDYR